VYCDKTAILKGLFVRKIVGHVGFLALAGCRMVALGNDTLQSSIAFHIFLAIGAADLNPTLLMKAAAEGF